MAAETNFIEWARASLAPLSTVAPGGPWEDLEPFGKMVGEATVVALGEGEHFCAQPLQLRNRMFQYLVERKGFTAIAIESGIVEGRVVHDYVRGGSGDLSAVLAQGIGWTFDQLPPNRALVRWIREYNDNPRHERKVNFYGFDVPGSPPNPKARRSADTSLTETLRYLATVDGALAATFSTRLAPFFKHLRFDLRNPGDVPGYERLNSGERDALTAGIADLVASLESHEAQYSAASTAADYEWAHRAAIGARQVDHWLRQIPLQYQATGEQLRFLPVASELRDRAQADNLEWIVKQEGPLGKVLVHAHNGHLGSGSVKWIWQLAGRAARGQEPTSIYRREVAGGYLRRRFGKRLVTVGNLIGKGDIGCHGFKQTLEQVLPESMDAIAKEVGVPLFLLDLREAPAQVKTWLDQEHPLGRGFGFAEKCKVSVEFAVGKAFDALFYLDTVTPACGSQT